MREIKFRGKTIPFIEDDYEYKGEWVYGYFHQTYKNECFIIEISETGLVLPGKKVIPETVGQYSGLKDLEGTDIYEGDIYIIPRNNDHGNYGIFFTNGSFSAGISDISCTPLNWIAEADEYGELTGDIEPENFTARIQIIGNVIDNP